MFERLPVAMDTKVKDMAERVEREILEAIEAKTDIVVLHMDNEVYLPLIEQNHGDRFLPSFGLSDVGKKIRDALEAKNYNMYCKESTTLKKCQVIIVW